MDKLLEKLTSGRWILTVICGLTFAYLSCKKILPTEAIMGIIVLVFQGYFYRGDRNGGSK